MLTAIGFGIPFLLIWLGLGVLARKYLLRFPAIGSWFEGGKGVLLSMIALPVLLVLLFAVLYLIILVATSVL